MRLVNQQNQDYKKHIGQPKKEATPKHDVYDCLTNKYNNISNPEQILETSHQILRVCKQNKQVRETSSSKFHTKKGLVHQTTTQVKNDLPDHAERDTVSNPTVIAKEQKSSPQQTKPPILKYVTNLQGFIDFLEQSDVLQLRQTTKTIHDQMLIQKEIIIKKIGMDKNDPFISKLFNELDIKHIIKLHSSIKKTRHFNLLRIFVALCEVPKENRHKIINAVLKISEKLDDTEKGYTRYIIDDLNKLNIDKLDDILPSILKDLDNFEGIQIEKLDIIKRYI